MEKGQATVTTVAAMVAAMEIMIPMDITAITKDRTTIEDMVVNIRTPGVMVADTIIISIQPMVTNMETNITVEVTNTRQHTKGVMVVIMMVMVKMVTINIVEDMVYTKVTNKPIPMFS